MTNWAEGMFAVESRWQRKMKLPYTVEERFKVHMEATHWEANPRLVRTFMEKTADTIEWLEEMGCEFEGVVAHYPGRHGGLPLRGRRRRRDYHCLILSIGSKP